MRISVPLAQKCCETRGVLQDANNSCIRYVTSLHFAILACRTLEEIKAVAGPQAKLEYMLCDVSSFKYADHIGFIPHGSVSRCQICVKRT